MRIGVITPEYPPYTGGGIGTATESFVSSMGRRHQVDVFAMFSPDQRDFDAKQDKIVSTSDTVTVHYLSYHMDASFNPVEHGLCKSLLASDLPMGKSWIVGKKIERFLATQPLDVLFVADFQGLAAFFLITQRQLPAAKRIPVITTLHNGIRELNRANYLSPLNLQPWEFSIAELEQITSELSTVLHAPSHFLANFVTRHVIDRPVAVIPNFSPFDPHLLSTAVHVGAGAAPTATSFLFIGRLERRKGIKELVQVLSRLLRKGRNVRLTILGADWHDEFSGASYTAELKKCIPSEFSDHFDFRGSVPHDKVGEVIHQHDAVVIPSLFDNYPNTCMEAVAAGRIALHSTLGGMSEIVGEDARVLFDPNDQEGMGDLLEKFIDLPGGEKEEILRFQREHYLARHEEKFLVEQYEQLISSAREAVSIPPRVSTLSQPQTIGIGIPVYNTGPYLDACLESVLQQTRPPDEIVIIDDGSTDSLTLDKLLSWQEKNSGIRLVRQENHGLCATRNRLMEMIKTDFVLLFDSDDVLDRTYLEKTEQYMLNNPAVATVVTWVKRFEGDESYWLQLPFRFPSALVQNRIVSSVGLMRRETIGQEDRFHEGLTKFTAEDWDFWIGYHGRGNEIALLPEPLFHYRVRKGSKWHTLNYRKYMHIMEHFIDNHPELFARYHKEVILRLHALLYQGGSSGLLLTIFNSLPVTVQMLLRRNKLVKKIAYLLLSRK